MGEVRVVEQDDGRKGVDGTLQVGERALESGLEFIIWNVVPPLHDAHGNALFGGVYGVDSYENEHHVEALLRDVMKLRHFGTVRI